MCDDSYAEEVNSYFFGDSEGKRGILEDYPDFGHGLEQFPIFRVDNLLDEMTKNTKEQINKYGSKRVF